MEIDRKVLVGAVLITALTMRLPFVFQESLWNDEAVYMWMGEQIVKNPLFVLSKHPAINSYGYVISILTAVFTPLFGAFAASRVATLAVSLAGVLYVFLLGEELTNEWGGTAASMLLATNPQHVFFSVRSLTDVYLATAITAFAYYAVKYDRTRKAGVFLAASLVFAVISRIAGILLIPIAGAVLLEPIYRTKKIKEGEVVAGALMVGFVIALMVANLLRFGSPLSFTPGRTGGLFQGMIFTGSRTYYMEAAPFLYTLPAAVLSLVGGYLALSKKWVVPVTALVYFSWFSLLIGEKVPRYVLQTIPLVVVLAAFGLFEIVKKLNLDRRWVAALALVALTTIPSAKALAQSKQYSYTGLQELGEKVGELDSQYRFNRIYAQSMRQIRAFSGIEYVGDGGKLHPLPKDVKNIANESGILLQLDVWEYTAPAWAYPLTQEKLNRLLAMNFTITHIVQREVPTQQGMQRVPVGLLLVK